ncbi:21259_t:CDS:2, partial [Racocetra persica]
EKKLREQNLSSDNNSPEPSNLSYKDQNLKSSTILQSISSHSVTTSGDSSDLLEQLPIKQKNKTLEIDIKPLIQELNIKTLKEDTIKIVNVDASEKRSSISSHCVTAFGKNSTDNQSPTIKLVYLFERICFAEFNTMRAKQDEIASWYSYRKFFEKKHSEILPGILKNKLQLTKQKAYELASSQIYDEMLCYLSEDKILRIKTYSANKLSKLTDAQIDIIIYEVSRFTEKYDTTPPLREKNSRTHMTEPSNSTKPQISNSSDSEAEVSMSNTPDSPISRKLDINVTSSTK